MNKTNHRRDVVPASQMLNALKTLQLFNCCEDNDVSFGEHTSKAPLPSEKTIDFQIYMEKQADKRGNNVVYNSKKLYSPFKDQSRSFAKTSELPNSKRKSLNPTSRCNTNKSLAKNQIEEKEAKQKQLDKQNRQKNLDKASAESNKSSKVSSFSQKILDQRQKKGNAYVPIQMRAECLLKERQAKIAKLQKDKEMEKMLEEKQCTFKPRISKSYVRKDPETKKSQRLLNSSKQQKVQTTMLCEVNESSIISQIVAENAQTAEVQNPKLQPQKDHEVKLVKQQTKPQRIGFKKYKNEKFNSLLDLLH